MSLGTILILGVIISILILQQRGFLGSQLTTEINLWTPEVGDSFQWQLTKYPVDTTVPVDIYDVDYLETSTETISELKDSGKRVVCYINVGAWEDFRDDAHLFPPEALGNDYEGWEGEKWLDISRYELFSGILEERFDLAAEKGCDAIEPDNMEAYNEETGFELTYNHQLDFNIWLAEQVHLRGMSIGLKNNPEQVADLVEYYDWALLEDCHIWGFCEDFKPFIDANKAVLQVEYTDSNIELEDFCPKAEKNEFFGLLKERELNSWVKFCTN